MGITFNWGWERDLEGEKSSLAWRWPDHDESLLFYQLEALDLENERIGENVVKWEEGVYETFGKLGDEFLL